MLQAALEIRERLDVVVDGVFESMKMIEIDVRQDESPTVIQNLLYLGEFLELKISDVFKHSMRENDIEVLVAELDFVFKKIHLRQIWRGVVYSDIDPVIVDISAKKIH